MRDYDVGRPSRIRNALIGSFIQNDEDVVVAVKVGELLKPLIKLSKAFYGKGGAGTLPKGANAPDTAKGKFNLLQQLNGYLRGANGCCGAFEIEIEVKEANNDAWREL